MGTQARVAHQSPTQTTLTARLTYTIVTMTFPEYEQQVKQLVLHDRPFSEIEERIERTPLTKEQQSALWLCAWSLTEKAAERVR